MIFQSWSDLLRIPLVGIPAYFALLAMLRISGNRTLSKFNAFDLVITVSFGSVLAAAFLQNDIALVQIIGAMAAIVLLQFLITWSSARWDGIDRLVKHDPRLVFHDGQFLLDSMRAARMTRGEILLGLRAQGMESFDDVFAVVLEPDGTLSVVKQAPRTDSSLSDVESSGEPH